MKTIDLYLIRCPDKVGKEESLRCREAVMRERYGRVPPVITEPGGKPRFAEGGEGFSVSHSENYFAMAFCDGQIGVDLEITVKESTRIEAIARRFFSEKEQEQIRQAADPRRAFTRLWTQKEALGKRTGEGVFHRSKSGESVRDISSLLQEITKNEDLFGALACAGECKIRWMKETTYETLYEKR